MSHYTERLELSHREKRASQGSMAAAIERQRKQKEDRGPTDEEYEIGVLLEKAGIFATKEGTRILEIVESLTDRLPK